MRFKISTHPPLPQAKAWCPLPPSETGPAPTILTLKQHLVRTFPTVRAYSATVDELVLELDGFELLDPSALADLALTGGDVIDVKLKPGVKRSGKKRRTEEGDTSPERSAKKRKSTAEAPVSVEVLKKAPKRVKQDGKDTKKDRLVEARVVPEPVTLKEKPKKTSRRAEESTTLAAPIPKVLPAVTPVQPPVVKPKTAISSAGSSRKLSDDDSESGSESDSSSSSTSTSSSSASSSSSSSTSSSTSDSSDSDSDSDAVLVLSSKPAIPSASAKTSVDDPDKTSLPRSGANVPPVFPVLLNPKQPAQPPVPPGEGSSKTKERNQRRKLLRQAARERTQQASGSAFLPDSDTPAALTPIATPLQTTTTQVVQSFPVPTATANRNKSKTYMKGMEGRAGKKTVYSDRLEEEVEGYAADVSMADGKEEIATPVKQAKQVIAAVGSGQSAEKTTPLTKLQKQKQTKANATPAKSAETPVTSGRSHASTRPRFTAPSALDVLPPNMFVTSVYFPWPHGKHAIKAGKNKARGEQGQDTSIAVEESVMEVDEEAIVAAEPAVPSAETNAPTSIAVALTRGPAAQTERERKRRAYLLGKEYVAPEDRLVDDAEHAEEEAVDAQIHGSLHNGNNHPQNGDVHATVADWERAEQSWDELKVIATDNLEQLVEGIILAWKALEMDLTTFTPEIKVKLGQVMVVKRSKSETPDQLYQIRVLSRPDAEESAEDVEEGENMAVDMTGVTSGEYRLLR